MSPHTQITTPMIFDYGTKVESLGTVDDEMRFMVRKQLRIICAGLIPLVTLPGHEDGA